MTGPSKPSPEQQRDELLASLAAEAGAVAAWREYASYCRERIRGLRADALTHLHVFLQQAALWSDAERHEFTQWVCVRLERFGHDIREATPQPMVEQLLQPALRKWIAHDPHDPVPHRWLGLLFPGYRYFRSDSESSLPVNAKEHLRKAIAIDAHEQPSRIRLVELLLDDIWWDTHRLPDFYIGQPTVTLEVADEALALITGIEDTQEREALDHAVRAARQLVEDWVEFNARGGGDFINWCLEHQRSYEWVRHYYFKGR